MILGQWHDRLGQISRKMKIKVKIQSGYEKYNYVGVKNNSYLVFNVENLGECETIY